MAFWKKWPDLCSLVAMPKTTLDQVFLMKEDAKHTRIPCITQNIFYWQKHMLVLMCVSFLLLLQCFFCRCTMENPESTCSVLAANGGRSIDMGKHRFHTFSIIHIINYHSCLPACLLKKIPRGWLFEKKRPELRSLVVTQKATLDQVFLMKQDAKHIRIACV